MKDKNQAKQLIQVIKDNYLKDYYRFKIAISVMELCVRISDMW